MKKAPVQAGQPTRDLTTLEYVILGFLGIKPRSGYDIMNSLETGIYRASASTGSIYPILKRLEKLELITSIIEAVYETRPRKVHSLLPAGEQLLDDWLRRTPTMAEVIEGYDIAMHKFLVSEYRLSRDAVLEWLDSYEAVVTTAHAIHEAMSAATRNDVILSVHAELINRSLMIEIESRLAWIKEAQARLRSSQ
jgi:DNA-binding PadR family transcriptional regulator